MIDNILELKEGYSTLKLSDKQSDTLPIKDEAVTFIQDIEKEVKQLPQQNRLKYFKMLKVISLTIIPLIPMMNMKTVNAQTTKINIPIIENQQGLGIIPVEIFEILIQLIGGLMILGCLIAIVLLMFAGAVKMMGDTPKAIRWTTQILTGLGQLILAPLIVIVLVTLVSLILGNIDGLDIFY